MNAYGWPPAIDIRQPVAGLWFSLAVVFTAGLASAAYAGNAACWGGGQDDPTRPDISCVPLTEALLTSLEGATKPQVQHLMNAPGAPDADGTLRFESNYAFRTRGSVGFVNVKFNEGGQVNFVDAAVEAPHHGQGIRFIWNAAVAGCSDFPDSMQRCDNILGLARPVHTDPPRPARPIWKWLPAWLARQMS